MNGYDIVMGLALVGIAYLMVYEFNQWRRDRSKFRERALREWAKNFVKGEADHERR